MPADGAPVFEFDGFSFGGRAGAVLVEGWDRGEGGVRVQDVEAPGRAAILVGRDLPAPPSWTFELATNVSNVDEADALVSQMGRLWRSERWQRPGVVGELRYRVGSSERLVVGRPRRFTPPNGDVRAQLGAARFMCDFQLTDPRSFSDTVSQVSLTLVPESSGGLIAPLIAPLTGVARGGVRAGVVNVGGTAPAPVRVAFHGPVSNPVVFTDEWEIGLTGNLAWDVEITVDALTGEVFNQDGASVGGRLTRRTRLRKAALSPGPQEIRFTGADATGTATATVSWRDAAWGI